MEKGIYYEQVNISNKVYNNFVSLYNKEKQEIIKDLKKIIKEKYNIDIIEHGFSIPTPRTADLNDNGKPT